MKQIMIEQINMIIEKYEDDYKWGGSEDLDGNLGYGFVDFGKMKDEVLEIIETNIGE